MKTIILCVISIVIGFIIGYLIGNRKSKYNYITGYSDAISSYFNKKAK